MDLVLALTLSFACLLTGVIKGYFIAYPLLVSCGILSFTLLGRGFSGPVLLSMAIGGIQTSLPVLSILLLIGAVTATWMAAGTVPALVYYGVQLIHPHWFILAAFLLTSAVSLLIGTSFGAASTIGVALMIMAKGSAVDPHLIAGAIIAGAYLGDRCSPMSSSANLIATITRTDLYANLRTMMTTGWLPLILAGLIYAVLSLLYPVQAVDSLLLDELKRVFQLNWIVGIPALVLVVLAVLRVEVKRSMLISIAVSLLIAVYVQGYSFLQVFKFAVLGFRLESDSAASSILLGGGMLAMAKVSIVVILSTAIAGILAGTRALSAIELWLKSIRSRSSIFLSTTVVGLGAAAFGCTQTIAILLTQELVKTQYAQADLAPTALASDLEDTVVVLAPLIPWNIAGLVPATILMSDAGFIPYACYLYLIPLLNWTQRRLAERHQPKSRGA